MTDQRPDWLPHDQFPFNIEAIDLPSGRLTYVDEGDGPTLLFVHAGMWTFIFRDAITRLRPSFRCIAMDFPGYGLNADTETEYEITELSGLLGEFVNALDLADLTLVVHDLGGPVGLHMAGQRPERISGLVLTNTFAWSPDRRSLRTMFRVMGGRTMTAIDVGTNLIPKMTSTRFGVGRHLEGPGRSAFLGPFRRRDVRRRFHRSMRSTFRNPDWTDEVERITRSTLNGLPVLTIFGEKNDPFGFQERHAATFPDHEGVLVEGGNHFPMMDDPDLFADSIAQWHARRVARSHA